MDQLELIQELGPDADLLVVPDECLENQRRQLSTEIDLLCRELEGVLKAQRYKRRLQQANRVAVRTIERDRDNRITDVQIKVMSLPQALQLLRQPKHDRLDEQNTEVQYYVWSQDGYDLETTSALRRT